MNRHRPGRWPLTGTLMSTMVGGLVACAPEPQPGSLPPTLSLQDATGGTVAMQNGIPVPTFDWQPRARLNLDGTWQVETAAFDADLSLTDRDEALPTIVDQADGRTEPGYDAAGWRQMEVPGTLNPPPHRIEVGGWYRRAFSAPQRWAGQAITLKFGAVNYIADVWLNGTWLGYHEGGYTPFAFDVSSVLRPGDRNVVVVRVDNPTWGTRNDIVPWGLADWWNYGGITRSVWLEAVPTVHAVRADVVPHLDGADVSVVVHYAALPPAPAGTEAPPAGTEGAASPAAAEAAPGEPVEAHVRLEVLPVQVTSENVTSFDPRQLVPAQSEPLAESSVGPIGLGPGEVAVAEASFLFGGADRWELLRPALYALRVTVSTEEGSDELWTTFGLRSVTVEPESARLLLNGEPTMLRGVALHDEVIVTADGAPVSAHRPTQPSELLAQLEHAREVGARLIRAGHTPANPLLLMLTDRLGFAVWEEIPLYHYTPLTFDIAMRRGIPQQMLREMALRDFNRPSVLFHGLANESTGGDGRQEALAQLHEVDREIDGTRLTGQAAYGSQPEDPTHEPLDVGGYTFYYGVFYGADAAAGTGRALELAHATHPHKPVMALEFGRWMNDQDGAARQRRIFEETFPEFRRRSTAAVGGYVAAAVWWTLEDYTTLRPGIDVEHFGLFAPDGIQRPVAQAARAAYGTRPFTGELLGIESDVSGAQVEGRTESPDLRLVGYLGYALLVAFGILGGVLFILVRTGGRALAPPRAR